MKQFWELYPECSNDDDDAKYQVTTDFTPNYLFEDEVPSRIAQAYMLSGNDAHSRIKIFLLLREPVARVQSYFYSSMNSHVNVSKYTFGTYVKDNLVMSNKCTQSGGTAWPPCTSIYNNSLSMGLYGEQLSLWLQYFTPEQFFIIPFTSYIDDPETTLTQTAEVIGATMRGYVAAAGDSNTNSHNSIGEDLDDDELHDVVKFFKSSNQHTYDLINQRNITMIPGGAATSRFLDYNFSDNTYPYGDGSSR